MTTGPHAQDTDTILGSTASEVPMARRSRRKPVGWQGPKEPVWNLLTKVLLERGATLVRPTPGS